jgi:hypothetical protein
MAASIAGFSEMHRATWIEHGQVSTPSGGRWHAQMVIRAPGADRPLVARAPGRAHERWCPYARVVAVSKHPT